MPASQASTVVVPSTIVVMGVAGCGKSTVAALLADRLGWDLLEGDSLHPARNVERMSAGVPLDDADRAPWLAAIADRVREGAAAGRPLVVACSALARRYRDVLRGKGVVFAYLAGTRDLLESRIAARSGHFMKPGMLDSQLRTLEPPQPDEAAVTVDIDAEPEAIVAGILSELGLVAAAA
ncbi:gluconokinase [Leifsonia sp. EB41]|uniref:gluconokinase n=1 Tax=Leifsonia sp. EB41 TaxID=3156260 RepID=UPI0035193103